MKVIALECLLNQVLVAINGQELGNIEDIFYDYKDDSDLEFNLCMFDEAAAEELDKELSKIANLDSGVFDNPNGGGIVIRMPSLHAKNEFLALLRSNGWRPNGG